MSDVPVWSCEAFPLKDEGSAALDALTVGAKFGWKCHGDLAVNWDKSPLRLGFAKPEEQYSLQILKVERLDPNDVQFVVTSYKTGEHKPEYIRFLQGAEKAEHGFEADHLQWGVKSVLDPKQPPQPAPSFGPWSLQMPWWFIVAVLVVVTMAIWTIVRRVRKGIQRRRMLNTLKTHNTALPPLHQFYRDSRLLRRRLHNIKDKGDVKAVGVDLDREFRLFVLRQFQIPTLDWSNRSILEDLRRRHRRSYRQGQAALRAALRELDKMKSRSELQVTDLEQLLRMCLEAAERLMEEETKA